jgi:hypothetical protein
MIRKLGGIAVGMAVALLIMIATEALGHRLFGAGLGPDGGAPPTEALPAEVQAAVLFGWFLASLIGGYAAVWISRVSATAWAVGGLILLAVAFRFMLAPAPQWMIVGGILAAPFGSWLAQQLPRGKVDRPTSG